MKTVILLTLICGILSSPVDDSLQEFVTGNHKFTVAVYKEILKADNGNFIVSPFSAEAVLALANEGAKGDTSNELVTGLSLPSAKEKVRNAFKSLLPKLRQSEKDLKLLSANKIYVEPNLELEEDFNRIAKNIYESGVSKVDFKKTVEAAATINQWVEENTNNKIKNLIQPDALKDAVMVLVNTLYFSGRWTSEFHRATSKGKFFKTRDDAVLTDVMFQENSFNYFDNPTLNAIFLELPYRGDNISMTIVLPNEIEGLANLEQNIEQLFAPQPFTNGHIYVEMPKFTIESSIQFKLILQNLGVTKMFTTAADFTGLSSTDKDLLVSDVIQKTFINVTEAGTEAAAATGVIIVPVSARPDPEIRFRADHPFLYFIKHNDVILFTGRYTTPSV